MILLSFLKLVHSQNNLADCAVTIQPATQNGYYMVLNSSNSPYVTNSGSDYNLNISKGNGGIQICQAGTTGNCDSGYTFGQANSSGQYMIKRDDQCLTYVNNANLASSQSYSTSNSSNQNNLQLNDCQGSSSQYFIVQNYATGTPKTNANMLTCEILQSSSKVEPIPTYAVPLSVAPPKTMKKFVVVPPPQITVSKPPQMIYRVQTPHVNTISTMVRYTPPMIPVTAYPLNPPMPALPKFSMQYSNQAVPNIAPPTVTVITMASINEYKTQPSNYNSVECLTSQAYTTINASNKSSNNAAYTGDCYVQPPSIQVNVPSNNASSNLLNGSHAGSMADCIVQGAAQNVSSSNIQSMNSSGADCYTQPTSQVPHPIYIAQNNSSGSYSNTGSSVDCNMQSNPQVVQPVFVTQNNASSGSSYAASSGDCYTQASQQVAQPVYYAQENAVQGNSSSGGSSGDCYTQGSQQVAQPVYYAQANAVQGNFSGNGSQMNHAVFLQANNASSNNTTAAHVDCIAPTQSHSTQSAYSNNGGQISTDCYVQSAPQMSSAVPMQTNFSAPPQAKSQIIVQAPENPINVQPAQQVYYLTSQGSQTNRQQSVECEVAQPVSNAQSQQYVYVVQENQNGNSSNPSSDLYAQQGGNSSITSICDENKSNQPQNFVNQSSFVSSGSEDACKEPSNSALADIESQVIAGNKYVDNNSKSPLHLFGKDIPIEYVESKNT